MRMLLLGAVLLSLGCASSAESGGDRVMGNISYYADPVVLDLPDTVAAGRAFTVAVRTYGDGCVEKGDTEVEASAMSATIVPHDIRLQREICTRELRVFEHTSTLRFEETGTAEIVVQGLHQPDGVVITVRRTILVQ